MLKGVLMLYVSSKAIPIAAPSNYSNMTINRMASAALFSAAFHSCSAIACISSISLSVVAYKTVRASSFFLCNTWMASLGCLCARNPLPHIQPAYNPARLYRKNPIAPTRLRYEQRCSHDLNILFHPADISFQVIFSFLLPLREQHINIYIQTNA
jgi:hypothetical protein